MQNPPSTPQLPSPVPGLSGLTVIARGGYSTVYKARQESVGREVALKIDTRSLDEERDRRRFLREAEAAGRMSGHPNVVNVYDAGVTGDNHPYLVMELCSGGSYASRLKKEGRLSAAEVRDVGVKIADALHAAHSAGILHRDVKPGNILINAYGVPGLADFGLAALPDPTRELSVTIEALTPAYAPPEVFRLETPSPSGDVYALAASLYAMLSGRPPRWPDTGAPSLATMIRLHDEPLPDLPGVPIALTNVLRQGLAAEIAYRYPSAQAFRDALAAASLDDDTVVAPRPVPPVGPPAVSSVSGPPPVSGPLTSGPSGSGPSGRPPVSGPPAGWAAPPAAAPFAQASPPPYNPAGYPPGQTSAPPYPTSPPPYPNTPPPYQPAPVQHWGGPPQQPPPYVPAYARPGSPPGQPPGGPLGAPKKSTGSRGLLIVALIAAALLLTGAAVWGAVKLVPTDTPNSQETPLPSTSPSARAATSTGPSPSSEPVLGDIFGDCPLGQVSAVGNITARCPEKPECWGGIVDRAGDVTARSMICTKPHSWETFLIGELPDAVKSNDPEAIANDETIKVICGPQALSIALRGESAAGWSIEILPPDDDEYASGKREFRCVAGKGLDELNRSYFATKK